MRKTKFIVAVLILVILSVVGIKALVKEFNGVAKTKAEALNTMDEGIWGTDWESYPSSDNPNPNDKTFQGLIYLYMSGHQINAYDYQYSNSIDINADGLPDTVNVTYTSGGYQTVLVWLNQGNLQYLLGYKCRRSNESPRYRGDCAAQ